MNDFNNTSINNINLPSPLYQLEDNVFESKNIELYIKRDDLISELMPGNKYRKLRLFIEKAKKENIKTLISFGGAYSNHLKALSGAGLIFNFNTIGIIRGEEKVSNLVLDSCINNGMNLEYLDRNTYKNLRDKNFQLKLINDLKDKYNFKDYLIIDDGGYSKLAALGASDIIKEINIDFDYITTASGTGTTLAGLAYGLNNNDINSINNPKALGFAVLKGANFLNEDVNNLLDKECNNWELNLDYHLGGFAKRTLELDNFIEDFKNKHNILLDHIYTAKMFYGIYDLIDKNYFKENTKIVALHTGGFPSKF